MWRVKATPILVVIGALGLIKRGIEKDIQQIPGNTKIHELQKIRLLGTSHILRKNTLHQIDFYLILTLGPRIGLGYYVVLWYYNKENDDSGAKYGITTRPKMMLPTGSNTVIPVFFFNA